uniref:Uncharacterized protein n=1 Tax=Pristionchus pacificus TaxID=54126 RepID=A0A2A6CJ51_PRIPA|eukprot:PDM78130.1 hypothetical protein PRIPAC_30515 [Pristionchus pacificus]
MGISFSLISGRQHIRYRAPLRLIYSLLKDDQLMRMNELKEKRTKKKEMKKEELDMIHLKIKDQSKRLNEID